MSGGIAVTRSPVPWLIRRNTMLLATSQALTGAGMGLVYSIGPLMVVALSGSMALSGLAVTMMGLSRFLVAYPVGRVTDQHGRKPAALVGLSFGLLGAVCVGLAMLNGVLPLLIGAMLVFGMGMNAAQQLRVAATDMYPPYRRAEGLGYVLSGSLIGVLVGPVLVTISQFSAPQVGVDPLSLPWLMLPALILPGMYFVTRVRPDPKEIASRLSTYYPDYKPAPVRAAGADQASKSQVTLRGFLGLHPRRVAAMTNVAVQGNMAVVMVSSSLLLHQHGSSLSEIAFSSSLHSVAMWGFSIPIGRLADRVGRRLVLLCGGITATLGAIVATQMADYWAITTGAILVGLGWSASTVSSTVVVADTVRPAERGRGVGLNDSMAAVANMLVPLIAGPMGAAFGVASTGLLAAAMMVPPILLLFTLRERKPGEYETIGLAGLTGSWSGGLSWRRLAIGSMAILTALLALFGTLGVFAVGAGTP